jgi:hypothetical protein
MEMRSSKVVPKNLGFAPINHKEWHMVLLSKILLFLLAFFSSLALGDETSGLSYFLHDWELACDNTRTCRAVGYQSDSEELSVSVLLTRKAGPNEPVTGELMIGQYGENPTLDILPLVFKLSLRINERPVGQVTISKSSLVADFTSEQVKALLAALIRNSRIELTSGNGIWRLSDKGATAVLLKMDDFQGRVGTPGALVKKGHKDERAVLPSLPVPLVIAKNLPKPLPADQLFAEQNSRALTKAIRVTVNDDDCSELAEAKEESVELTAIRLSETKMLISTRCWMGAYNFGIGFWVVNSKPPYQPVLVTTSGSELSDSNILASHKGRGLGDCWHSEDWTWDGKRFVHTEESSTGICKLLAPGGAWSLPTIVTKVRPTP